MVAINSLNLCIGVFTRVNNNNPDEKSVLDYVCITKDITDLLLSMYVDEKKCILRGLESGYQKWYKRLNLLMHKCFKKKRIVMAKSLYNK